MFVKFARINRFFIGTVFLEKERRREYSTPRRATFYIFGVFFRYRRHCGRLSVEGDWLCHSGAAFRPYLFLFIRVICVHCSVFPLPFWWRHISSGCPNGNRHCQRDGDNVVTVSTLALRVCPVSRGLYDPCVCVRRKLNPISSWTDWYMELTSTYNKSYRDFFNIVVISRVTFYLIII